jgi:hypothetical protein
MTAGNAPRDDGGFSSVSGARKVWVRVPVLDPLNPISVWEHTPLDYYRCGEYPRFIRGPEERAGDHPWRWEVRDVSP